MIFTLFEKSCNHFSCFSYLLTLHTQHTVNIEESKPVLSFFFVSHIDSFVAPAVAPVAAAPAAPAAAISPPKAEPVLDLLGVSLKLCHTKTHPEEQTFKYKDHIWKFPYWHNPVYYNELVVVSDCNVCVESFCSDTVKVIQMYSRGKY